MSAPIRLNLLGPFELLTAEGEPLAVTGRKLQALLAYLGASRRREHSREEVAALLWGDLMHERSRHNLRQALSKLRRIREDLVVLRDDLLGLDEAVCAVDVREFQRLVAGDAAADLERALALYRGDLLEGVVTLEPQFDEWLRGTRSRLRDACCAALERLADRLAAAGETDRAVELLQRRLVMDPACEAAHRGIMQILHRGGRRSDALRQFERCREALRRELDVTPSAATLDLHDAIRGSAEVRPAPDRVGEGVGDRVIDGAAAATGRLPGDPPSIAVLPFENLSSEDHRYFADGLCEDLITALSKFSALFVIARSASFRYRDRNLTPGEIGRELRAEYLVSGSVQRIDRTVRLNIQLLDATTGQHVWAQRFDREIEDVLLVQDEITATVVSTLAGRVEAARLSRARRIPADRLDAYDYVLRGKDYHHRYTEADCDKAIEMFERAIELDGEYALAHAWLACGLGQTMNYRPQEIPQLLERAHAAAERGRQLDEDESECHRILAQVFILRRNLVRAQSHQERALLLNANDDRCACAMGEILCLRGQAEAAEPWIRKAMRLNPYHPEAYRFHLGRALFQCGRRDAAAQTLRGITRPRTRDLAYLVAASDGAEREEAVRRLRAEAPGFAPEEFVASIPFEREEEPAALLAALRAAGLPHG